MKHLLFLAGIGIIWGAALQTHAQTAANTNENTVILPTGVEIMWEAETYTPPFYRGKALGPRDSTIRFIAFPDERFGDPSTLFYTWRSGTTVLGDSSGIGQNVLVLERSSTAREQNIIIEIKREEAGDVLAAAGVRTPSYSSELLLYENDPVLGVLFEEALQNTKTLMHEELVVSAYPFFFSSTDLPYKWRVNNDSLEADTGREVTLRKGTETGTAQVKLSARHPIKLFQSDSVFFSINF